MPLRILVVDDHPVVRRGLRTLLSEHPGWEIIAEAGDGVEAVEMANRMKPDVILLDVTMPKMDGLEACRLIRKAVPECEILILTQHNSTEMIREALGAGAKGYVVKSDAVRDLPAAIEAMSQHKFFPPPTLGPIGGPR